MELEVVVDVRERALDAALGTELPHVKRVLDVGDVSFVSKGGPVEQTRLLVERKTLADFAASIKDGRYREQKARIAALLAACPSLTVVYVIEVGTPSAFSYDARMRYSMMAPSLQSAAVTLSLTCSVVMTRDVEETAAFLRRAFDNLIRRPSVDLGGTSGLSYGAAACAASVKLKKRENVDVRQCFLQQLCQVPGVSVKLATTLSAEFGSMEALYRTLAPLPPEHRLQRLARLPLIGDKLSRRIHGYLFDDSARSSAGGGPGPERDSEGLPDAGGCQVLGGEVGQREVVKDVQVAPGVTPVPGVVRESVPPADVRP
jgi:ERCC4-type nuclease